MKKILSVAAILAILSACKSTSHGSFEVSGKIINAPGKKITLLETPYGTAQPIVLDFTLLKENGDFVLHGRATDESVFRLVIDNGPNLILINDNDKIKLHLDVNDYRGYTVEGSPASESLHKLFEEYREKDSLILVTFKKVDSVRALGNQDTTVELLQTSNDLQITGLNNLLRNYINNTPSPSAALYALGIASQTIPEAELKTMVDATANKFPSTCRFGEREKYADRQIRRACRLGTCRLCFAEPAGSRSYHERCQW